MPDIKFDKQLGRRDNEHDLDLDIKEELIIEPNIDAIRNRKPYLVTDFNKQTGRNDNIDITADEYFINVGTEEEKMENPGRKSAVAYDFGKPKQREADKLDGIEILQPDVLIVDPELLPKKIKGNVKFYEGGERFPQDKEFDPMCNMRPPNTEMRIDQKQGIEATRVKVGKEQSFPKAGTRKVSVKQEEEKYQKSISVAKEAKTKYQVAQVFNNGNRDIKPKKKPTIPIINRKKAEPNLDAQIDQYMKELGLI